MIKTVGPDWRPSTTYVEVVDVTETVVRGQTVRVTAFDASNQRNLGPEYAVRVDIGHVNGGPYLSMSMSRDDLELLTKALPRTVFLG